MYVSELQATKLSNSAAGLLGTVDPFVTLGLGKKTGNQMTKPKGDTVNPKWEETLG